MCVILFGVFGVGKGIQVWFIIEKFGILQIFIGDMLCVVVKVGSLFGQQVKGVMDSGGLVFDDIIIVLIKECIIEVDCVKGFLFDGFLWIILQVEVLKDVGVIIDYVVEIVVDDEEIVLCIVGCCVYLVFGCVYYIEYNLLKVVGKDDVIGEELIQCEDDKEEIVCYCLLVYYLQIKLLVDFYQKLLVVEGILKYYSIVGVGLVEQIIVKVFLVLS